MFEVFDRNHDGYITVDELRYAYSMLGEPLSEGESRKMIDIADIDKDGMVSYEDFTAFCSNFWMQELLTYSLNYCSGSEFFI